MKPLYDRVLVKRTVEKSITAGGIIIPESAKEKAHEGTVVAVGDGELTDVGLYLTPGVKPGDRVVFGKYNGSEIKIDGEPHLMMREWEILAVIEP